MEKRRHQRMEVSNLVVDISDGYGFFSGTVEDLSRHGLKLDDIPKRLDERSKKLSLIISDKGKHFKIRARLRWAQGQSFSKKVGLEIVKAPLGWAEFVMKFEPKKDFDDAWGVVHL